MALSSDHEQAISGFFGSFDELARVGRVHIRYDPGQLTADPAFYAHATSEFEAIEYLHFKDRLTSYVPVCGEGFVDEGGTCSPTIIDDSYCVDDANESCEDIPGRLGGMLCNLSDSDSSDKSGCSTAGRLGSSSWLAIPLVMLFGARRQQRH